MLSIAAEVGFDENALQAPHSVPDVLTQWAAPLLSKAAWTHAQKRSVRSVLLALAGEGRGSVQNTVQQLQQHYTQAPLPVRYDVGIEHARALFGDRLVARNGQVDWSQTVKNLPNHDMLMNEFDEEGNAHAAFVPTVQAAFVRDKKFRRGQTVQTQGVANEVPPYIRNMCLRRHAFGEWGLAGGAYDSDANDAALKTGARIFSSYRYAADTKLWIITEADRSVTTLLLPGEY